MADEPFKSIVEKITCREVATWTSAYIDGHLDDYFKVRMVLHLAVCAGCTAYVRQIAAVRDVLGMMPGKPIEPALREKLRQAYSTRQKWPQSTQTSSRR